MDYMHVSILFSLAQQVLLKYEGRGSKLISQIVFETMRILEAINEKTGEFTAEIVLIVERIQQRY